MSARLFRRIWLVNGILLLLLLLLGLGSLAFGFLSESPWFRRDEGVRAQVGARAETAPPAEARAVRYDLPETIRGTQTQLVRVRHGRGYETVEAGLSGPGRYPTDGPVVNVLFYDPSSGATRLLLDRPAYIETVDFPSDTADSLQTWIAYELALEDTDRNGRLDEEDRMSLFVSDLEGRGLHRVLGPEFGVREHRATPDGRGVLVYALEWPREEARVGTDRLRQRAFVYDVSTAQLRVASGIDSLTQRAGQVLGRP